MITYQGSCDLHPGVTFPVRADIRDAQEDTATHINKPGGHTVRIHERTAPPAEADGFEPAGVADRVGELCESILTTAAELARRGKLPA